MQLKPELLLYEQRNNLTELLYYGYIVYCSKNKSIKTYGKTDNYPFFHRSCAKPLQASIIQDLNTKDFFNLTDEEITVCCASHTGEPVHLEILRGLLKKINLTEKDLQCPAIEPLSKEEQKKYTKYSKLHNNCSGKHTLMLAVCRQMGWDIKSYLDKNHPLQKMIYSKIQELCEDNTQLPYTLDGCTAPNYATSLEALTRGFYNMFCTQNYPDIKNAVLKNPYLMGGKDRPETQIMQMNQKLIAKAGAGGLLCIVNTETDEVLTIKIADADMRARNIIAIEIMLKINWLNNNTIDSNLLKNSLNNTVTTETGQTVGGYILSNQLNNWISTVL